MIHIRVLLRFGKFIWQPIKSLIQSIALSCTCCLNIPLKIKVVSSVFLGKNNDIGSNIYLRLMKLRSELTLRFLSCCSPNFSVNSLAFMALGKSCLFAKINTTASLSSSSFNCNYQNLHLKNNKIYIEDNTFSCWFIVSII